MVSLYRFGLGQGVIGSALAAVSISIIFPQDRLFRGRVLGVTLLVKSWTMIHGYQSNRMGGPTFISPEVL